MSISYGITKQHGGGIWVESDLGVGSMFHIGILILSSTGNLDINEPELQRSPVPHKPLRILVMDDEADIRTLVASLLSLKSSMVELAENGNEAWAKLQSNT